MTFAALLVTQKREKRKVSLCFFAGEQCSPLPCELKVQPTPKRKNQMSYLLFLRVSRHEEKAIKKKCHTRFRVLRSATDATVGSCRLTPKAAKTLMDKRDFFRREKKCENKKQRKSANGFPLLLFRNNIFPII